MNRRNLVFVAVAAMLLPMAVDAQQTGPPLVGFLHGSAPTEEVVRTVLTTATVDGLRVRAADLAEVFRALAVPA